MVPVHQYLLVVLGYQFLLADQQLLVRLGILGRLGIPDHPDHLDPLGLPDPLVVLGRPVRQ